MKQTFTASTNREGDWFVAQCVEVDVASQGETKEAALLNLREAIELYLTPAVATPNSDLPSVEIEIWPN